MHQCVDLGFHYSWSLFGAEDKISVEKQADLCVDDIGDKIAFSAVTYQLRARRVLLQFSDVPLRTRRGLSLYKVYGDSTLLVLSRTPLNSINALLVPSWWYLHKGNELLDMHVSINRNAIQLKSFKFLRRYLLFRYFLTWQILWQLFAEVLEKKKIYKYNDKLPIKIC